MIKNRLFLLLLVFTFSGAPAQLDIDTLQPVDELLTEVLFGKSSSLSIDNVEYRGDRKSIGMFRCPLIYNKMISEGIILSTGDVFDAIGPNTDANKGTKTFINSDEDLSALAKGQTFDAAILEFDFVPSFDSVCFNFFFASEEYPEYVNKHVNDVFGFFLSCKDLNVDKNLALLKGLPIAVDNVNAQRNKEYFINNQHWDSENTEKWEKDKATGELAMTFQFDGFTVLMHAGCTVVPGQKYHIKLAIADVGDRLFDSALFLEAGSFNSVPSIPLSFEQTVKEVFGVETVAVQNNTVSVNLNIRFDPDAFQVVGEESIALLDRVVQLLKTDPTIRVEVRGHTDESGTKEHNNLLSDNRAKNVAEYLIKKNVASGRITSIGFGDSLPISNTDKGLNRRVEFVFSR